MDHYELKKLRRSSSQDLHIVSAGPSLKNFDFSLLKSKDIMTINNAILHIPTYLRVHHHVYCEPVEKEKENYIKMSAVRCYNRFSFYDFDNWIKIPPFSGIENLAFEVGIEIAIYMGYKKIYLYGYDFSCIDNYMYWWENNPRDESDIKQKIAILARQKNMFNSFVKKYAKLKDNIIKIYNHGGDHDFILLEEYINE